MAGSTQDASFRAAFVAGAITVIVIALLAGSFLLVRVGLPRMALRVRDTVLLATGPKVARVLDLPGDVRAELTELGAVISNAGNPTENGARDHDTFLTRPDPRMGWVLRPGVEVEANVLRPRNPMNLDPPILYMPGRASLSARSRDWLRDKSRLRFRYSTNSSGRRSTVPIVDALRTLLVVGDSVAFGEGVNDSRTVASLLQGMLGTSVRVVNAGVGGYTGAQVLESARSALEDLAEDRGKGARFDALVYLSSQNDFMEDRERSYEAVAEEVYSGMAALRVGFSGKMVTLQVSYLEFIVPDFLLAEGWSEKKMRRSQQLYEALPDIARRHGFAYVDWRELVRDAVRDNRSIFASAALYVDHGHLSPEGSRFVATAIRGALEQQGYAAFARADGVPVR